MFHQWLFHCRFCRLYQLSQPSEGDDGEEIVLKKDVWYILDEFGSSLQQSSTPNSEFHCAFKLNADLKILFSRARKAHRFSCDRSLHLDFED